MDGGQCDYMLTTANGFVLALVSRKRTFCQSFSVCHIFRWNSRGFVK